MRTVTGPTDRVVIVGAGLGGLAAALRLAGAGRQVTVLERESVPGGRAGLLNDSGYQFDTGPTVLTMPQLIDETLAAVGESRSDWLDLLPLDPVYRAFYPDGSQLDIHPNREAMATEIARVCGPTEAAGYERFADYLQRLYDVQFGRFIDRNLDGPLSLLGPDLARLVALGGFRRLGPTVARYLHDPRTQRAFSFQSLYAGVSPQRALALYAVISYLDTVAGVWFPKGGIHALPRALAAAASKHGVDIRYGVSATRVERVGGRAVAVYTSQGERLPTDVVVLNPDLPVAQRDLLGVEPRRLRYSPSCFLLLVGSSARYRKLAHHNLHFGRAWSGTFDDLESGHLMRDPSLLVSQPTYTDASLAPADRHSYYVLAPTPNTTAGLDWPRIAPGYRDQLVETLEARGYLGFGDQIEVEHTIAPHQWAERGLAAGTPFAAAHTFGQTGPFRPGNLWGDNVVFVGSGTQPGVGVPMVLLSGKLGAARITGARS